MEKIFLKSSLDYGINYALNWCTSGVKKSMYLSNLWELLTQKTQRLLDYPPDFLVIFGLLKHPKVYRIKLSLT